MTAVDITSNTAIEGNILELFKYVVPIDVNRIFERKGIVPGVQSSSNTEKWYKAGQTRTIVFDDNSQANETLESVIEPESFSYTITGFSSILRFFVAKIDGTWTFQSKDGMTAIAWKYSLHPRKTVGYIIIKLFIEKSMQWVLDNALRIIKSDYERSCIFKFATW